MLIISAAMELAGGLLDSDKLCLLTRSLSAKGVDISTPVKAGEDKLDENTGEGASDTVIVALSCDSKVDGTVGAGVATSGCIGEEPVTDGVLGGGVVACAVTLSMPDNTGEPKTSFSGVKAMNPLQKSFLPNCTLL